MIIYNAKITTMNSRREIIENGWVEFENGIITKVSSGKPDDISEGIDAKGSIIYPGFIDAHTHLGLTTNGVGVESEDFNEESEPCTPQLRIMDGINPMDESFGEALKAGITTAICSPGSANAVAGDIVAIKTYGKRIDKMVMRTVGMKFSMGENPKMTYMNKEDSPYTRMAIAGIIREALKKAQKYHEDYDNAIAEEEDTPEYDIKSEALIPVLMGKTKAHFHCHRADDIFTAIRIAKEFNLNYTLVHCTDGYLIADELKDEDCTAIVGPVMCDRCKPELANLTPANAGLLDRSGIKIAICTDHSETPIQYLPLTAGIAVKNGLAYDSALEAITINAAEIAGIDDRTGSVEVGKDADLVMFAANPLEVMSSPVLVIAGGKIIDINNI